MFVVVWQFEVAEEKIAGFEAAYSAEGSWAQLFRASPGYQGTELLRDAYIPGTYLTIDRWASEEAFRAFRKDHDADYEALDRACDKLTSREVRIGAYTVCAAATRAPSSGTTCPIEAPSAQESEGNGGSPGHTSVFSISSLFFSVIVCPALLQSHRNPIHAAAPFPRTKEGDGFGEYLFRSPQNGDCR